jgi:hypothetical protein
MANEIAYLDHGFVLSMLVQLDRIIAEPPLYSPKMMVG